MNSRDYCANILPVARLLYASLAMTGWSLAEFLYTRPDCSMASHRSAFSVPIDVMTRFAKHAPEEPPARFPLRYALFNRGNAESIVQFRFPAHRYLA